MPLRFSLDGPRLRGDRDTFGLDVLAESQPQPAQVACPRRGSVAEPKTVDGVGRSRLMWNPFGDQYVYLWKADRKSLGKGTCWSLTLTFNDAPGTKSTPLLFEFK